MDCADVRRYSELLYGRNGNIRVRVRVRVRPRVRVRVRVFGFLGFSVVEGLGFRGLGFLGLGFRV
jgi:hypothetical protein